MRLRGSCVGLCVMAGRENEYHGCSWGLSCCGTGCVAWQGKQSSSSSSSSGRSLLILLDLFLQFSVAKASVGDAIRLLQLEAAVGRDAMAVGVEYQGGLGRMGCGSAMVIGVVNQERT